MIVPMKKAAILVQPKDSADTIESLRSLGVVHVEHQQLPKGKDISALREDIALIDRVIAVLSQEEFLKAHTPQDSRDLGDWKFTAKHILDLCNRLNQLKNYALTLNARISQWEVWGDFDPEVISAFRSKGIYIRLYQLPVKEIKNLPAKHIAGQAGLPAHVIVKIISTVRGIANCAIISQQEIDIPFKEVTLPKIGLAAMKARLSENNRIIDSIKDEIRQATCYRKLFWRIRQSLEEELKFHQALSGMGQAEGLMYLTGYIPYDAVRPLQETAKKKRWGIMINEPCAEDRVPTLIRNPRWVSIIRPVFKLIELIPGYKELDISLWFLIFFSIFFGMLIGDAGIGLIFLTLIFLAQRKWGPRLRDKSLFVLLYISCACAVAWGMLTGTFFGQEWLPQSVKPLIPALRSDKNIQTICFLLGAIHLSIAHAWRGIIKLPSFTALAECGWILILWGAFFLARMLVLGDAFSAFGKWLFILGAVLVVFFTDPNRNFLKGIGAGFGNLLLNFVNSFTDVVSYVRLFAVGLATVAVADAFNRMAMDVGYNSIIAAVVSSLILLLGHMLNVLLAPMSILVHGVRLNLLEFCNHADVKWSGFAYQPLRKS